MKLYVILFRFQLGLAYIYDGNSITECLITKLMIKNIIDELTETEKSLSSPLLKVLVFAKRVGNEELYRWVYKECYGYDASESLPLYRLGKQTIVAESWNSGNYLGNKPIPISIYGDKYHFLKEFRLNDSVKALEETASGKFGDTIQKKLSADMSSHLNGVAKSKGHNYIIQNIEVFVPIVVVSDCLNKIRAMLLELLLNIEEQFPEIEKVEITEIKSPQLNQFINNYMTKIIINSSGQGNIITTGDNNEIKQKNVLFQNVDELKRSLQKLGVQDKEINEIVEVVQSEQPSNGLLGEKSSSWIAKMFQKSLTGLWQVSSGTIGGILTELIKGYYGL